MKAGSENMCSIQIVIEVDAVNGKLGHGTIYVNSENMQEMAEELTVEFKDGISISNSWPKWPEKIEGKLAYWRIEPYIRHLKGKLLYSYGLRIDLLGVMYVPINLSKWYLEKDTIYLDAQVEKPMSAVIGPFIYKGYPISWRGKMRVEKGDNYDYIIISNSENEISLSAKIHPVQPLVTGFFEYEAEEREIPIKVISPKNAEIKRRIIARLPDLLIKNFVH